MNGKMAAGIVVVAVGVAVGVVPVLLVGAVLHFAGVLALERHT